MKLVLVLSLCALSGAVHARDLTANHVECERVQHSSGDKVILVRNANDGSISAEIGGYRGWTKNLNKIFNVNFEVTSVGVTFVKEGCKQKDDNTFPLICHAGKSTVTISGKNGETEVHPAYFAMVRLSTASLDDLYDYEHRDAILARMEFATQKEHEVEISTVFKTKECSAEK